MKKSGVNLLKNKSGQVTLFIIIAIVLVSAGVLIYLFRPGANSTRTQLENPSAFIDSCIRDKIAETKEIVSLQGGTYDVGNNSHYLYQSNKLKYLCYTNQYYTNCVVQEPLLIQRIEYEIKNEIQADAENCFEDLKTSYQNDGYTVNLQEGDTIVELLPERVSTTFNNIFTYSKGSNSQRIESFNVVIDSNLYQIASISSNIIEWENAYGQAPTSTYMNFYHNLKIEKHLQFDGTNIYILTDSQYGDVFQFASRSLVLPPGY